MMLFTTLRFSLSDRMSRIRTSIRDAPTCILRLLVPPGVVAVAGSGPGDLLDVVGFDRVAFLHIPEVHDADTALVAGLDLLHIFLEATQRRDPSVVDDDAVANDPCSGVAVDRSFCDVFCRSLVHSKGVRE